MSITNTLVISTLFYPHFHTKLWYYIPLTWREREKEREIHFDYQLLSMHSWHSFIHFDALIRIFSIQLSEKELRKKRLSVRYCRHVCCCVMLWLPGFVDIILLFFIILVTIVSFRGEGGRVLKWKSAQNSVNIWYMIEMFYEKQKKFFNRKWQKGSGKTLFTVN